MTTKLPTVLRCTRCGKRLRNTDHTEEIGQTVRSLTALVKAMDAEVTA